MPLKKWSRQEEEKKVKDRMTETEKKISDIAEQSKERRDALRKAVPGIHRQQENDVLQSAEDWCQFYEDETAWLQQKANLEAEQALESTEALPKLELEWAALRKELDELKIVKKEPEVGGSEWIAIYKIRDLMIEHPKMVLAFFDEPFMAELKKTFETKWSNFDRQINELEDSVYDAIHTSSDLVKRFLETDFNPRLGQVIQELRTVHTETLDTNTELESQCDKVKVRLDEREQELVESQAQHMRALQRIEELESKCAQDRVLSEEREEKLVKSQAAHAKAVDTIKELESQFAQDKILFKKQEEELVNDFETKLAEEKNKFRDVKERATRYSSEIAGLETRLDEETKKLEKVTLHRDIDAQYALLAKLDHTKTTRISARPIEELKAIITRAAGFTQSTSNIEADTARILDSTNTDLPEGTQLIADISPNVFFLITTSGRVDIFDKADIRYIEYDTLFNIRLVMDEKSLLVCGTPRNVEKNEVWESWMNRYAEGVVLTAVAAE